MARALSGFILASLLAGVGGSGWTQTIYTCIDGKGRRQTSDRPIQDCMDREQKELNASGTVRRSIGPSLTVTERAAQEERDRKAAEEQQRHAEERRMQKALLTRYPNQAVHDQERAKALKAVEDIVSTSQRRIVELQQQQRQLDTEAEFYKDRTKWPVKLKRQVEDTEQQMATQQRFIAAQDEEKRRIDKRFDEELAKLRTLWTQTAAATMAVPAR